MSLRLFDNCKFYTSPLSLGLCVDGFKSDSPLATLFMDIFEDIFEYCDWTDCKEKAVRIGAFPSPTSADKDNGTEFRGLCKRHKQLGMWTDADSAWGWL